MVERMGPEACLPSAATALRRRPLPTAQFHQPREDVAIPLPGPARKKNAAREHRGRAAGGPGRVSAEAMQQSGDTRGASPHCSAAAPFVPATPPGCGGPPAGARGCFLPVAPLSLSCPGRARHTGSRLCCARGAEARGTLQRAAPRQAARVRETARLSSLSSGERVVRVPLLRPVSPPFLTDLTDPYPARAQASRGGFGGPPPEPKKPSKTCAFSFLRPFLQEHNLLCCVHNLFKCCALSSKNTTSFSESTRAGSLTIVGVG